MPSIDGAESPIEHPKKKQKHFYSGKKKRHTLKSQLVVDKVAHHVMCTSFANGKRHDFRLFKEPKVRFHDKIKTLADSGYHGIQKLHAHSELPKKRTKKCPLSKADKSHNRRIASERVINRPLSKLGF